MKPFQLAKVKRVEFYKRDEITTDLICCEITLPGEVILVHEDMPEWDEHIQRLEFLGGFDVDWFAQVSQPPFDENRYVAFARQDLRE